MRALLRGQWLAMAIVSFFSIISPPALAEDSYRVTAGAYNAGGHPNLAVTLNGFEKDLAQFNLRLPEGLVVDQSGVEGCTRASFAQRAAIGEAVLKDPEHNPLTNPDLPINPLFETTSLLGSFCSKNSKVGTIAIKGAGYGLIDQLMPSAISDCELQKELANLAYAGIPAVISIWDDPCSRSNIRPLIRARVEETLSISALNRLEGDIFNCEVYGPGSGGADAQLCITFQAIPDDAIKEPAEQLDPEERRVRLLGAIRDAEERMGKMLPSRNVRFTCKRYLRDAPPEGDYGSNLKCSMPSEFMYLPNQVELKLFGEVDLSANRTPNDHSPRVLHEQVTVPTQGGVKSFVN